MDIEPFICDVPGFPKEGIVFKDITPLLGNAAALQATVDQLTDPYRDLGVDVVVGVESRGFLFGTAVAERLNAGFVPVRKPGKLPREHISESYDLEYGSDNVEIHVDSIQPGQRVLMVDDLIATGGTMAAACKLVKRLGGEIVGASFVIELDFLNGKAQLAELGVRCNSLIKVSGE